MKRILALILCAALLAVVFTACGDPDDSSQFYWEQQSENPDSTNSSTTGEPSPANTGNRGIDYEAAFASYTPDTIMFTAGGFTVAWDELFFNLRSVLDSLVSSYGELPDLHEFMYDGRTYAQAVLDYAVDNVLVYRAVEYGAKQYGVTFSEDDHEYLQSEYEEMSKSYGGMEEFLTTLWEEDGISSLELFYYLYSIPYLAELIFKELYGADGSLLPDEDVEALTAFGGYLMAKHILRMKTEDGDDTPREEIDDILQQLDDYSGDDFDSFFDSLMFEHSDDAGGLASFPSGYLFQYGDMVPEFYDACVTMEIGEYSDAIETSYGFHIIYKLPVNYDEVPMYNYSQYDFRTLRGIVSQEAFSNKMNEWVSLLIPEYAPILFTLDLKEVFK